LAAVDDPLGTGPTMISEVPSKGVRTIYSRLGDWFAWLSMAVLLILIAKSLASVPKHDAAAAEANTR
jgi:apolipoprotein N-acyltransferase